MSKRSFRIALTVVGATIAIAVIVLGIVVYRISQYPHRAHAGKGAEIEVDVTTGMSFPKVARMLADKHVIDRPRWFRLYAMWRGDTTNVKTGHYVFKDDMTPAAVLDRLIEGVKEVGIRVTLPEGKNMLEYFQLIDEARVDDPKYKDDPRYRDAKICDAASLERVARDPAFLAAHGIASDSVEGYLFPDTYELRANEKPEVVLERLIAHQREVWNSLVAAHGKGLAAVKAKLHWSDHQVLIMASIVEKEAVDPAERPRIAQVFINRLTDANFQPKRLETDPTIRYGCMVPVKKSAACQSWDKTDRLHRAQLDDTDNPYNTYRHEGLPPGPISNPGKASILAVMEPDGSNYFYFVARDARNHVFSKTIEEHRAAVDKYMK